MNSEWPKKDSREAFEINGFIEAYAKLRGTTLSVEVSREKPDYWLREPKTGPIAVELTSVYSSDRSVPDRHIPHSLLHIPDDPSAIEAYKSRLVSAVAGKLAKARSGYDLTRPLVLSVYVNEYEAIYLEPIDFAQMVRENDKVFRSMTPFSEIVFWGLRNNGAYAVSAAEFAEQAVAADGPKTGSG